MNPELAKRKQKEDAAARAAATAPSQVNAAPPMVYQAPQINVPANRHEMAILIQEELTKIQQSQSALLSMLESLQPSDGTAWLKNDEGGKYEIMPNNRHFTDACVEWLADGSSAPQMSQLLTQGRPFTSWVDWSIRAPDAGGGHYLSGDMNTAPANSVFFQYASAANSSGSECTVADFGAMGSNYRLQLAGMYGPNQLKYRTRNGDNGIWHPWQQVARYGYTKYAGNTSLNDWHYMGGWDGSGDSGERLEVRQWDDGNGQGPNSPGAGYGTAIFWRAGGFATQVAYNQTGGGIYARSNYASSADPWHYYPPSTLIAKAIEKARTDLLADLVQLGLLDNDQIAGLPAREYEPEKPEPKAKE